MKKSVIGSVIIAAAIIGLIIAFGTSQENVNESENPVESPKISDSANVTTGANFIIDENGNKVFIISVGDKPNLDD